MLPPSLPSLSCIFSLESKPTNLPGGGQHVSGRFGRQGLIHPKWANLLSKQKKISFPPNTLRRVAVQTRLVFCFRLFFLLLLFLILALLLTINKKCPGLVFRFCSQQTMTKNGMHIWCWNKITSFLPSFDSGIAISFEIVSSQYYIFYQST